jgi:hypothetical protein
MQTPFVVDCIKEPEKTKAALTSGGLIGDFASEHFRSAHRRLRAKAP